jgi:hypothetical protein
VLVDLKHLECGDGGGGGSDSLGAGEGVVADPAQKIVGDPRGASATACDFGGGGVIEFHSEEGCGAAHDRSQVFDGVVVEAVGDSETGAKGGTEEAGAGGCTDEGEAGEIQADGASGRALVDNDIDPEVLNGGVEILFDDFGQAVNFIDEEDISLLKSSEETGEIACFFDRGTRGGANGGIHFRAQDVGESGFPESRRSTEEKVIEGLGASAGGVEKDSKAILQLRLAGEVGEARGAKGKIDGVAGLGIELFKGLGGHGARMAEGGKFESGKVNRYARWR